MQNEWQAGAANLKGVCISKALPFLNLIFCIKISDFFMMYVCLSTSLVSGSSKAQGRGGGTGFQMGTVLMFPFLLLLSFHL